MVQQVAQFVSSMRVAIEDRVTTHPVFTLMEAMWTFSWSRLGCLQRSEFSLIQHGLHSVKESNMQPHT